MGGYLHRRRELTLICTNHHSTVRLRCDRYDNGYSSHPAGRTLGDGLCVAEGMLSGVGGPAPGHEGNSGLVGLHTCNGSKFSIIPSRRIIMDGKRMLTWFLSVLSVVVVASE
jgi:hypothetical protein